MNLQQILFDITGVEYGPGDILNLSDVDKILLMGDLEHQIGVSMDDKESGYGIRSDEVESWNTFDDVVVTVSRFYVDIVIGEVYDY